MARTTQDLATRTMQLLGLIEANETISAEDYGVIVDVYENRHAEWTFRELVWWPLDVIPNEAFESLARMMAEDVAPSFETVVPQEQDEDGQIVSMGQKGLRGLKRIKRRAASGLPTPMVSF